MNDQHKPYLNENRSPHANVDAAIAILSLEEGLGGTDLAHIHEITLRLNDIRELFIAPEYDPFATHTLESSGLEHIAAKLKPTRLDRKLRVVIHMPQAAGNQLINQTRAAIERYCRVRIDENRTELASLRWQGFKALQTGVIFLTICLALSAAAGAAEFLPEALRDIFSEGFLIAGWVSLWHPVEILLYEWWPLWRQIHIHQHIMNMELEFQSES
jgi:hypothetical protein